MENCNCHNEIILKGSGQLERYLEALDPSYVSIDGRSLEDLLVFAKGYADQVRFYDMPDSTVADLNNPKASWAEFFKRDMAVIAASIATVDLAQIKNNYDSTGNQILVSPGVDLFKDLLNQVIALVNQIDQWYSIAIPENPLYADINLAINSTLSAQLKKAIAYEEGFIVVDSKTVLNIDYTKVLNQQEWGLNDPIDPEFDIYQGTTPEERILSAVSYVDDIFHAFYGVVSNIVNQSTSYINFALTQYPAHQPYMALFIAFLKLFNLAQQQINGLTGKMLNYYYRDILQLTEKPAVPDKVYVVFQLAQNVAEYDLPQGTALSAGKDASGIDQVYKTETDFVINQAAVKELKNIFIQKTPAAADEADKTISAIFANPIANSMDGNGKAFSVPNSKWLTFGNNAIKKAAPQNICEFIDQRETELNTKNTAEIGFAIASPQLVLQGGNRLIGLNMSALTNISALGDVQITLTGEKGWLTITNQITDLKWLETVLANQIFEAASDVTTTGFAFFRNVLYIYLPVIEQGIIAFDPKIHTGSYTTTYPVMQVLIGPDIELAANPFHNLNISDLSLFVQVGSINTERSQYANTYADGLKTLFIKTDTGVVTPGKAFDPFTTLPYYGASFYIGSDEVFNKPFDVASDQLTANIRTNANLRTYSSDKKMMKSEDDNEGTYAINVINNRSWIYLKEGSEASFGVNILSTTDDSGNVVTTSLPRTPVDYHTDIDVNTDKGFLRIDNFYDYEDVQTRINAAPSLQIKEISVSYISNLQSLDATIDQFFHIYPFGTVQTSIGASTAALQENPLIVNANNSLLPQFTYLSATNQYQVDVTGKLLTNERLRFSAINKVPKFFGGDNILDQLIYDASGLNEQINGKNNQYTAQIQEEGMLYIGLTNLQPLQNLSLLFQFADGSALDEDDVPPSINWSYLVYNAWQPLNPENIVSDSTYGFQTTGIVNISMPADANDNHTIVTNGLYWLCASVTENSACIPQLINVVAQAAEVQFFDQGNSPAHYDSALPAGSIGKLSVAVSQVSKVTQPFASFDGKPKEAGKQYYTRISERLRHKGRAITAWDYEHLVLNQFPGVFKVKCITNTDPSCLCRKPVIPSEKLGKSKCCGAVSSTGNVLIVPVPNLKNNNAANPLQPKTNQLTLIEIVKYLTPLTSPFVKIYAKNPVYEQVIVFFRVQFLTGIDKGYCLTKLNDEIVQYLTPWAFDQSIEADFGQKIYASAIINFIQQRPYVDFITDFLMGVCRDECCPTKKPDATRVTQTNFITALDKVSGCSDIENFLQHQGYFIGETIAEPSSQMSLLVSAPKHIILLYEEPTELTPCEKRTQIHLQPIFPVRRDAAGPTKKEQEITSVEDKKQEPKPQPVSTAKAPVTVVKKTEAAKASPRPKQAPEAAKATVPQEPKPAETAPVTEIPKVAVKAKPKKSPDISAKSIALTGNTDTVITPDDTAKIAATLAGDITAATATTTGTTQPLQKPDAPGSQGTPDTSGKPAN